MKWGTEAKCRACGSCREFQPTVATCKSESNDLISRKARHPAFFFLMISTFKLGKLIHSYTHMHMCTCMCMCKFFLINTTIKIKLVQIWPIIKYLASFPRTTLWSHPSPGSMNKRKTMMHQIWQSSQGSQATVPTYTYITHLFPNCFIPTMPTYPLSGIWLRAKGRGSSSKTNGGRQGEGYGLRTYVHVYTHCREEVAEVMDGASLDQSVAGQSRGQVPLVCSGPN